MNTRTTRLAVLAYVSLILTYGAEVVRAEIPNLVTNLSIETLEGTTYNKVKLKRKTAAQITFYHSAGVCTINIADLTDASCGLLGLTNTQVDFLSKPTPTPPAQTSERKTLCQKCNGARTITCSTCRGGGFGQDRVDSSPCPTCGGDGAVRNRRAVYEYSGGIGKRKEVIYRIVNEDCPDCKGSGKIETNKRSYCLTCNGHGTMPCPWCTER
jgi:DnaJ-class molecular chaperone